MSFLVYTQAILAALMMLGILLQHRAAGASSTFGGQQDTSFVQRRGAELMLYRATVVISFVFFALTVLDWYV